jgi:redox-sensitive bicupin YhaK (pirin superfamily)
MGCKGKSIEIDDTILPASHQVKLDPSKRIIIRSIEEEAYILLAQGKAINEAVAQYGPFVMNTRSEIQQAYDDYHKTRFGGWPWDRNDPVHGSEVRRFSKLADGEEEVKI